MMHSIFNALGRMGRKIYRWIPAPFRDVLSPGKMVFELINVALPDLWVATGKEKSSQQELSIAFAGDEANRNYIMNLAYTGLFAQKYIGKVCVWEIPELVERRVPDCDVLVITMDRVLLKWVNDKMGFLVPCWLATFGDLSAKGLFACFNDEARRDSKRVLKDGFSFEITRSYSGLRDFYYKMYVPYGARRFGETAVLVSYEWLKKALKRGELMFIKRKDSYIAGQLLGYTKGYGRLFVLGVLDGDFAYVRQGVITALYYFSLSRIKEKGYKVAHLGWSRPFLKDGALQYKRRWGGKTISCDPMLHRYFYVMPLRDKAGLRGFLTNNPFIFLNRRDKSLNGAIFVDTDLQFSRDSFYRMCKEYFFGGMKVLYVYSFGKDEWVGEGSFSTGVSKRMRFVSGGRLFPRK